MEQHFSLSIVIFVSEINFANVINQSLQIINLQTKNE